MTDDEIDVIRALLTRIDCTNTLSEGDDWRLKRACTALLAERGDLRCQLATALDSRDMHRTLHEQTACPPAANASAQQACFDSFRAHYNEERPHEALGQRPPGEFYAPSEHSMPNWIEPSYDEDHEVRRVRSNGEIKWLGARIFISSALIGELVGIAALETLDHVVRFCDLDIGLINAQGRFSRFAARRDRLREPAEPAPASKLSGILPVQNVDNHAG